ncbi:endonuclease/exonuclease/phosphatase family protein, partial [Klebsiella pneumoniae]|uniref:endonuclease/exonuclease/phosphatase family protein n=1 Tax=Klebsiella pneumoniae TaxID=573 RepID=UPI001D0E394F
EKDFDFVGISETWFDNSHDWLATIQGYSLYRKDREDKKGGGVCLYVKDDIKVIRRDDITNGARKEVESLWIELQRDGCKGKVILGICYKPPNQREEGG